MSAEFQSIFDWPSGQRQPTPELYMRGMTLLELLWRQTIPGLSFKVVYDEPEQLPGESTRSAMALFDALQQNPSAQKWFVKHIRNAVVHSAPSADAISVIGDSIHFYEAKAISEDLGKRIFDRLTLIQKRIWLSCTPTAMHDKSSQSWWRPIQTRITCVGSLN